AGRITWSTRTTTRSRRTCSRRSLPPRRPSGRESRSKKSDGGSRRVLFWVDPLGFWEDPLGFWVDPLGFWVDPLGFSVGSTRVLGGSSRFSVDPLGFRSEE